MDAPYRRKNYFIDKSFQANFILKFCSLVVVSSFVIGVLILFFSQNSTTVAIENTKVIAKNTSDFILPLTVVILIIVAVFTSFAVIALTLFVSHRIAGPIFRLKREVEYLKDGDLNRNFSIRNTDQLQLFAKSLDEMRVSLKEKNKDIKEKFSELSAYLKAEDFKLQDGNKEVLKLIEETEKAINFFKT